ncbi:MAG: PDZ domain-containing protein [Planctomycetota bacterium]
MSVSVSVSVRNKALGGVGVALALLLCALALPATAGNNDRGQVTEVRTPEDGDGISVLVRLPQGLKVREGQSVEVLRGGKTIGYGAVEQVFSEVAVATIGTLVAASDPPQKDDEVRFLDGFVPHEGKPVQALPRGSVVSVSDGLVLLDFGKSAGLKLGHEVLLRDKTSRKELGRISVELLAESSGGGVILSGEATPGAEAVAIGFAKPKENIDFVQLNLLGAVAELENPNVYRNAYHVGVPVRRILPGSPAQRAGIARGDRILAVDSIVVKDIAAVRERIQARKGEAVKVLVIRGDRVMEFAVDFSKK